MITVLTPSPTSRNAASRPFEGLRNGGSFTSRSVPRSESSKRRESGCQTTMMSIAIVASSSIRFLPSYIGGPTLLSIRSRGARGRAQPIVTCTLIPAISCALFEARLMVTS